jgi:hypothetical protein
LKKSCCHELDTTHDNKKMKESHTHLAEPEMVLPQASTLVRRCLQEKAEDSSMAFEEGI